MFKTLCLICFLVVGSLEAGLNGSKLKAGLSEGDLLGLRWYHGGYNKGFGVFHGLGLGAAPLINAYQFSHEVHAEWVLGGPSVYVGISQEVFWDVDDPYFFRYRFPIELGSELKFKLGRSSKRNEDGAYEDGTARLLGVSIGGKWDIFGFDIGGIRSNDDFRFDEGVAWYVPYLSIELVYVWGD